MLYAIKPRFCGSLWPNGEFGVSRVRETPFLSLRETHHETADSEFNAAAIKVHGIEAVLEHQRKRVGSCLLGLSQVPNSRKAQRRGLKGITSYGAKMVRCAAGELERRVGRNCLTFATVTLPGADRDVLETIARDWSEITRLFVENLTRDLQRQGLQAEVLTVSELQSERFAVSGLPVLHLHLLFQGRADSRSTWVITPKRFDELWKRRLAKYYPAGTSFGSACNLQRVKYSAAGYLGKYMSKGRNSIQPLVEKGFGNFLPSSWWNCTLTLRRRILKMRIKCESVAEFLESLCVKGCPELFAWLRPVEIEVREGEKFRIGWAGRIHPDWYDVVLKQCQQIRLDGVW